MHPERTVVVVHGTGSLNLNPSTLKALNPNPKPETPRGFGGKRLLAVFPSKCPGQAGSQQVAGLRVSGSGFESRV